MNKWIIIGVLGLLGSWALFTLPFRLPKEYIYFAGVQSEMRQIGVSTDIFFHDNEDRQNVYLNEMPWIELSVVIPDDIVQPIPRNHEDPKYPTVIHKKYGTMADIEREIAKFGLRE